MLRITIPAIEFFNEDTNLLSKTRPQTLVLEHSLISLSKWEQKWKKPFLSKQPHTTEQTLDYVRCMTITKDVDELTYQMIPDDVLEQIKDYIEDPMTATWFREDPKRKRKGRRNTRQVTAELIYYKMFVYGVPIEFEKRHLNHLTTLLRVADEENEPQRQMSQKEIAAQNKATNMARRKRLGTKG